MIGIYDIIALLFFGSLGGFLSGFLGVGGGIIFVPILDYFLLKYFTNDSELVKAVLANSLFIIMFSSAIASYKQYRIGNIYFKEILNTLIPGIISIIIIHTLISKGDWYNRNVFLYFFLVLLVFVIVKMFSTKNEIKVASNSIVIKSYKLQLVGAFAGVVTAMSGLGGGIIMTPLYSEWLKMDIKKASAISTGVIFVCNK